MFISIGPYVDEGDREVEIRIDNYDTWDMDHTLSPIILPMLIQLKATKHGAPNTDDEDVPEDLRSTNAAPKENDWDTDSLWFDRWDWIMDEMIYAFDCKVNKDEPYMRFDLETERAEMEAEQLRISNGLRLFGKYFESLWD